MGCRRHGLKDDHQRRRPQMHRGGGLLSMRPVHYPLPGRRASCKRRYGEVWNAIANPDKIVIAQVAPAVRTAWSEELNLDPEEATVGKILDALKRMGVDYAFDTAFSADLTIMEEATEFLKRFTAGELKDRPCLPPAVQAGCVSSSLSFRTW